MSSVSNVDQHSSPAQNRRRSARLAGSSPITTSATTKTTHITSHTASLGSSKRSPSPRVSFTAAPLSPEPKGVQNITRKVIRRLEGLGHLDIIEIDMDDNDSERDREEKDQSREETPLRTEAEESEVANELLINGHANGSIASKTPSSTKALDEKKIDWEIPRKVLHSSIGFFTIYLYLSEGTPQTVVYVLWSALAVIAPADFLRLRYPPFARVYERFLGFLMRESEKNTTNGVIWYIIGVNFALTFYPLDVATVAILILSWADTAASTIGRMWGSMTPRLPSRTPVLRLPLAPRKSLAGFIAASITGACIAVGFWSWMAPMRPQTNDVTWWWDGGVRPGTDGAFGGFGGWLGITLIAACAGLVSGVAEALDLGSLDDNLTLPIISGGCILGFFKVLELVSTWLA